MPKRTKNLIHELIRSVEEDIEAIEMQLAAVASNKIVRVDSQRESSSLRKLLLQYKVLLSVLRDEMGHLD
jgi:hypothetical protein